MVRARRARSHQTRARRGARGCGRALHVLARDPAAGASAGDARELDAEFGGELARDRADGAARSGVVRRRRGGGRPRSRRRSAVAGHGGAGGSARRSGGRSRRRRTIAVARTHRGRILAALGDYRDYDSALNRCALRKQRGRQRARGRRLDFVQHFLGLDLVQRLACAHGLAGRLEIALDRALLHREAELGHGHFDGHRNLTVFTGARKCGSMQEGRFSSKERADIRRVRALRSATDAALNVPPIRERPPRSVRRQQLRLSPAAG